MGGVGQVWVVCESPDHFLRQLRPGLVGRGDPLRLLPAGNRVVPVPSVRGIHALLPRTRPGAAALAISAKAAGGDRRGAPGGVSRLGIVPAGPQSATAIVTILSFFRSTT